MNPVGLPSGSFGFLLLHERTQIAHPFQADLPTANQPGTGCAHDPVL